MKVIIIEMSSNIGRRIYGYCNGYFGRDDYDDKIVVAEGVNWVVCERINNEYSELEYIPTFVHFTSEREKNDKLIEWGERKDE